MCECNPFHETERVEDKFHAVTYEVKPCTCQHGRFARLWSTYKASASAAGGPTILFPNI